MECGTLKLGHILSMNKIMYHHHLLSLDQEETINKIFEKQKLNPNKNDWIEFKKNDFLFIEKDINEDEIKSYSKSEYKVIIKELITKAAFKYYLKKKETHSKLDEISYSELKLQSYLKDKGFSKEERELMVSLRSRCHRSKVNFRKLHKNDLLCRYGCQSPESQIHIFTQCKTLRAQITIPAIPEYTHIFKDVFKQKQAIEYFILIDRVAKQMKENLLPGVDPRGLGT